MSHHIVGPKSHPATFPERGAYIPLTTPMLNGGRVRLTERDGLELVIPKASGGRGNFLTPWAHIAQLWDLGVHDTLLLARVGKLRTITPATVREAGWQTAAEGFAGRRAQAAARQAAAAAQEAHTLTHYHLLFALVRQLDPRFAAGSLHPIQQAPLAQQSISQLAAQLGRDGERIVAAVGLLAGQLAPLGLGPWTGTARIPTLLMAIQALRQSVAAMPITTEWDARAVGVIVRTADITIACLRATLGETRAWADNASQLLKAWLVDPAAVTRQIGRAEWLADGWNWLCRLWSQAEDAAARHRALDEMVVVAPPIPKELAGWAGYGADTVPPPLVGPSKRESAQDELSVLDAIFRNETLLALAA